MNRLGALIENQGKTDHYLGLPPELNPEETPVLLGRTSFLILETRVDGVFLLRYTSNREFAGDTWHSSLEDAKAQTTFEFGDVKWVTIPADIIDVPSCLTLNRN